MQHSTTPISPALAAAFAAYEQLSKAEQQRAARLVASSGCSLALAVEAVLATRQQARP